jgi:hypothetical protein
MSGVNLGPGWIRSVDGSLVNLNRVTEIRVEYDGAKWYVKADGWETPSPGSLVRWAVLASKFDSRDEAQAWIDENLTVGGLTVEMT